MSKKITLLFVFILGVSWVKCALGSELNLYYFANNYGQILAKPS